MGRIAMQNGPFRMMKRPVSQPEMGRFANAFAANINCS